MNESNELQTAPSGLSESGELEFFRSVCDLIRQTRHNPERNVSTEMIATYYEIGRRIIDREQQGQKRAGYGKHILYGLSDYLTSNLGKGYSPENLKLMRRFYKVYSENPIGQSAITQFNPNISWTNYIRLMRIANEDERHFYEVEIAGNGWSVKEFQRQFDSSLYERPALSRDK